MYRYKLLIDTHHIHWTIVTLSWGDSPLSRLCEWLCEWCTWGWLDWYISEHNLPSGCLDYQSTSFLSLISMIRQPITSGGMLYYHHRVSVLYLRDTHAFLLLLQLFSVILEFNVTNRNIMWTSLSSFSVSYLNLALSIGDTGSYMYMCV